MKEIILSDHTGDQIRRLESERTEEHRSKMSAHRRRESEEFRKHQKRTEEYEKSRAEREDALSRTPFPLFLYVIAGTAAFVVLLLWLTEGGSTLTRRTPPSGGWRRAARCSGF